MAIDLTNLIAKVERIETVGDSIIALLNSIAAQIRDLPATQAALNDLAARVEAQATEISDAVVANTPAEEPPPVP